MHQCTNLWLKDVKLTDTFSFVFRIEAEDPIQVFFLIETEFPSSTTQPAKEQQVNASVSMASRGAVSAPTTPVSTTVKFVTEKPRIPSESTKI